MEYTTTLDTNIFEKKVIKRTDPQIVNKFSDLFENETSLKPSFETERNITHLINGNLLQIDRPDGLDLLLWQNESDSLTVAFDIDWLDYRIKAQWSAKNGSIKLFGYNEIKKTKYKQTGRSKWFSDTKNHFRNFKSDIEALCKDNRIAKLIINNDPNVKNEVNKSNGFRLTKFYANKISVQYKLNDEKKHISLDKAGLALCCINNKYYIGNLRIMAEEYIIVFKRMDETGKTTSRKIGFWRNGR